MTCWLIEHYDYNTHGHRWLRIWVNGSINGINKAELTWTTDAQEALRFSRKQDAEMFARTREVMKATPGVREDGNG